MNSAPKRIVLLGATGSIGQQTLDVVRAHPERFTIVGAHAHANTDGLLRAAQTHAIPTLAVTDPTAAAGVRARTTCEVIDGADAATQLAGLECDLVVNGITGSVGLGPTLAALHAATPVALANKESLVAGGELVVAAARHAGGVEQMLIPVDSEHSALAQALRGGRRHEVRTLTLTASGGPFRGQTRDALAAVTVQDALQHPTWTMGQMVTINSASMMNKGLEVIEAHYLFDTPYDQIDVVVHPESIVHSLVTFVDGSTLAQLSPPDMRLPIQLALSWPERLNGSFASLDFAVASRLSFEPVDRDVFRALDLAFHAGTRANGYPLVLNAANEVAVGAFIAGTLPFLDISEVVHAALDAYDATQPSALRDIADVNERDGWARRTTHELLKTRGVA